VTRQPVRIVHVVERTVPIASGMSNAVVSFREMTASLVAIVVATADGRRVAGFGFNSNGRYGAGGLLRERFIPRLCAANPAEILDDAGTNLDPGRIWRILMANEKPGGHGERAVAVGALDMAVWDLVAKIEGVPVWRTLADRFNGGVHDREVAVYAAGGYYYPDRSVQALADELRSYLDLGYQHVKIKVGGAPIATDLERVEAAIAVAGDAGRVAVDANGRFDLPSAVAFGKAIEPYRLRWYEEPGDPLDFALQADLGRECEGPFATGENLFAMVEARNLIRYADLRPDRDFLQFDPALSYGIVEYLRTLDMLETAGWSRRSCIPHGGHQLNVHLAAGLGLGGAEAYPGVFAPFGGFGDDATVTMGRVRAPEDPGIGIERKTDLYRLCRELVA
jgi:L-alanine-DL-glutamate epimerase-like enolase superfamily enzyme